jgi:type IV pilus assembly protein PilX
MKSFQQTHFHQKGSILFISIVMLAALTILGLSSMRTALTEEKISQSIQDLHIATEAAESALRHGQRQLKTAYQKKFQDGFSTTHELGAEPPNLGDWENDIYKMVIGDLQVDRSSKALDSDTKVLAWLPKYRLEEFFVPGNELDSGSSVSAEEKGPRSTSYFRVIARGLGLDGKNEVMLESVVIEQTR